MQNACDRFEKALVQRLQILSSKAMSLALSKTQEYNEHLWSLHRMESHAGAHLSTLESFARSIEVLITLITPIIRITRITRIALITLITIIESSVRDPLWTPYGPPRTSLKPSRHTCRSHRERVERVEREQE